MSSIVSRKVKAAAALKGISLTDVAKILDMSPSNLTARLRTGKFSFDELNEIAKAFGAEFTGNFVFPDGTEI